MSPSSPTSISLFLDAPCNTPTHACMKQRGRKQREKEEKYPSCGPRWHSELMKGGETRLSSWFQFCFKREHECVPVCASVCVEMRTRSCGVGWRELWTHIWLQGLSQTLGSANSRAMQAFQRHKQAEKKFFKTYLKINKTTPFAYFLQEFALDSELPWGHFLRVLTLGLAGSVRVGNVDPEFTLLLFHRENKNRAATLKSWVKSATDSFNSESASFSHLF